VLPKLIEKSRSLGADAVIDYNGSQRFGFFPWRFVRPVVSGTAIKWTPPRSVDCEAIGGHLSNGTLPKRPPASATHSPRAGCNRAGRRRIHRSSTRWRGAWRWLRSGARCRGGDGVAGAGDRRLRAALLVNPASRSSFVLALLAERPIATFAHFGGSALALAIGGFQLHPALRKRLPAVHRCWGAATCWPSPSAAAPAFSWPGTRNGGVAGKLGFAFLALAWLGTTTAGYACIRKAEIAAHRRWMIRSYALTFAAVTLRLYIPRQPGHGHCLRHRLPGHRLAELAAQPRLRRTPGTPAVAGTASPAAGGGKVAKRSDTQSAR
jgi:hypothetical protein